MKKIVLLLSLFVVALGVKAQNVFVENNVNVPIDILFRGLDGTCTSYTSMATYNATSLPSGTTNLDWATMAPSFTGQATTQSIEISYSAGCPNWSQAYDWCSSGNVVNQVVPICGKTWYLDFDEDSVTGDVLINIHL